MGNKKYYLTQDGLEKVRKEYEKAKEARREKIREESPDVFHSEDVNPEYLTFRKEMGILEEKITKLKDVLQNAEVIKNPRKECKEVFLGARITLENGRKKDELFLVGTMEADPNLGKVSDESPIGKALLGKKEGDKVTVSKRVYKIKKVSYS